MCIILPVYFSVRHEHYKTYWQKVQKDAVRNLGEGFPTSRTLKKMN